MSLREQISSYIHNPNPLWNEEIATLLVDYKWNSLKNTFPNRNDYSISGCILKSKLKQEETYFLPETDRKIQIALPSDNLSNFYNEHGLVPTDITINIEKNINKVTTAINMLGQVSPVHKFILHVVKSLQIIDSENAETDTSYSNPDIPFSVFFSVCNDDSGISDLRVSESILHETMHLFLSLIENYTDLILPNSKETFYSPWRDELRPVRGVLHGMFVFKVIKDFYELLLKEKLTGSKQENDFIKCRVEEIHHELQLLIYFPKSEALTYFGKELAKKLLSYSHACNHKK